LAKTTSSIEVIGNSKVGSEQFGKILEFRVWHLALKDEEIAVNSKTRLSGAAEIAFQTIFPHLVVLLLLQDIERLRDLALSQGIDIQISRCKI